MSSEQLGLLFPFPIFIAFCKLSLLCKSKAEILLLDILPRHCCRNHPPCPLPRLQSCLPCFTLRAGGLHVSLHTADCLVQEELCGVHRRISNCTAHKILSIEAYAIWGQGAQSLCCTRETNTVREINNTSILKSTCVKNTKQTKMLVCCDHIRVGLSACFSIAGPTQPQHPTAGGPTHLVFILQHQESQLKWLAWHERVRTHSLFILPLPILETVHHHPAVVVPETEWNVATFPSTRTESHYKVWVVSAKTRGQLLQAGIYCRQQLPQEQPQPFFLSPHLLPSPSPCPLSQNTYTFLTLLSLALFLPCLSPPAAPPHPIHTDTQRKETSPGV